MKYIMLTFLCLLILSGCGSTMVETRQAGKDSHTAEDTVETIHITNDDGAGYPHGNEGRDARFVCSDEEWTYVAQNLDNGSCKLIRFRKDGTDIETIYNNKNGSIFALNAKNNWIVFQLVESADRYENYYICSVKNNGDQFQKLQQRRVNDLWLYENRIYYSLFTKWGGSDLISMDLNGEDKRILLKRDDGLEFEIANDMIYAFYYDKAHDNSYEDCKLVQMDLEGEKEKKILDIKEEAYADTVCLWGNCVYYINEKQQLCRIDTEKGKIEVAAEEVDGYCIYGEWIYYVTYDDAEEEELCKVNIKGGESVSVKTNDIVSPHSLDVILDDWIYFGSDDKVLTRINCTDGKTEMIPLTEH